jgi:hypothetical protein
VRWKKGRLRAVLHDFLTSKREEIIARTKSKAAARFVPFVTEVSTNGARETVETADYDAPR